MRAAAEVREVGGSPVLALRDAFEYLVRGDVPEVEVRRQPAGRVAFRPVAIGTVAREPVVEELAHHAPTRRRAAGPGYRRDGVVDREAGEGARVARQESRVGGRPALLDALRQASQRP
jgi:hypothetical protein